MGLKKEDLPFVVVKKAGSCLLRCDFRRLKGGDIRKGAPSPAQYHRARLEGAAESAALPLNCASERSVSTRPRAARIGARERRRNDSVATCRRYRTEHYNAAENGQLYRFLHKGRNLNDVPFGRRDAGASRRSAGTLTLNSRVRHAMCARARCCFMFELWRICCGVCKLWIGVQNTNKRCCLVAGYLNRAIMPRSNSVL